MYTLNTFNLRPIKGLKHFENKVVAIKRFQKDLTSTSEAQMTSLSLSLFALCSRKPDSASAF